MIKITIAGATADELERARKAAEAVFVDANIRPDLAARAAFRRDAWAASGHPEDGEPNLDARAADVWLDAEAAAVAAACAGWPTEPVAVCMELT